MSTPPGGPTRDTTGTDQQANPTHSSTPVPGPAGTNVDTEGAGGSPGSHGLSPGLPGSNPDTTQAGPPGSVGPSYRAPSATPAASTTDTTRTDRPTTDGSSAATVPSSYAVPGTKDTSSYGGPVGANPGSTVPVAPAKPTVTAGRESVTVGYVVPTGAGAGSSPITGIEVQGSTGGTTYARKDQTSVVVPNLVPNQSYTFTVRAVNGAGGGPWSPSSDPVSPTLT